MHSFLISNFQLVGCQQLTDLEGWGGVMGFEGPGAKISSFQISRSEVGNYNSVVVS